MKKTPTINSFILILFLFGGRDVEAACARPAPKRRRFASVEERTEGLRFGAHYAVRKMNFPFPLKLLDANSSGALLKK
jgi:hypothetical protein